MQSWSPWWCEQNIHPFAIFSNNRYTFETNIYYLGQSTTRMILFYNTMNSKSTMISSLEEHVEWQRRELTMMAVEA